MKKKFRLLTVILIIIISIISGNTNVNGIDKYYFVIAIALDKSDDNNLLKLSVQIPSNSSNNSKEGDSSQSSNSKIYSVEGRSINECITILNNYLSKKINLSHCSALVISEELSKEGIRSYFNTFNNNSELRHSCQILISSEKALTVLENVSTSGEVFSSRLYDYLTTSVNYTAYTEKSTFGTIFKSLNNNYNDLSAIYTLVSDNIVQTSGIAVFKNDKIQNQSQINNSKNYISQIEKLNKQLTIEKNKNQELIKENNILKEKLNKLNMDIYNIQDLKNKIKSLEKKLNKKNEEIKQLLSQNNNNNNNHGKYKITSINPGEEIMCINFVSMGRQDINNYGLVCKNTDLFVRTEERLYEDFPQFKNYETYFEVNGKRIKRFLTLSENNIKDKNVINMFIIEE